MTTLAHLTDAELARRLAEAQHARRMACEQVDNPWLGPDARQLWRRRKRAAGRRLVRIRQEMRRRQNQHTERRTGHAGN